MASSKAVRRAALLAVAGAGTVVAVAACGGSGSSSTSVSSGRAASPAGAGTVSFVMRSGANGAYLASASGRTVYLFSADHGTVTACHGDCAKEWVPVTATTMPTVTGSGAANQVTLGPGGQVAYAGHLLYYFAGDRQAGDQRGQGLDDFGGKWSEVSPAGFPVAAPSSSSSGGGYGGYGG